MLQLRVIGVGVLKSSSDSECVRVRFSRVVSSSGS
jgi:hypothetical protein